MANDRNQEPQMVSVRQRQSSRGLFSPEVVDLVVPPLKFGGYAGTAGILAGVGGSIFQEANPIVWGAFSGFQWFTLGTSFWCKFTHQNHVLASGLTSQVTRSIVVKAWGGEERLKNGDKTIASAIAGTAAGSVGGLIRGPKNILPAMLVFTTVGAGGQMIANRMATRKPKVHDENESFWTRWSPLKKLTDQEYRDMMSEKMLRIDADIALIDDRIAELKKQAEDEELKGSST
ncbi:hypothetical protein FOCG_04818 [Fusarium oxysporum f. sp. radicis-lycopersici 26381]|uniref:Uncharacterized protein n=6 Tax=Fusarium oxysporum species complex TaxID=171631 RepID=A0A0J9WQ39_FUSO4|nr:hypothetical protein FOXG_10471 [Fusarium oxysporum f. sp. lycopersici 4287]XP_031059283.1 uncharacterized protein FOIG_10855 [Fusarium odoratissimum NRRL 54006]EWZ38265.1 hypothetical protein FOZG_09954 [Fusarium oxysporum Fo47]EWZ82825.1 hypothetical protein FOWG_13643 [Fusarium oxysporum f. sp. lycopersici MN25]EXA45858.1 hypothetical protein FOVG_06723 [Fusarium oxysporum f. sp. pisi HDV247]EXK40334.1 hypothetical protein FOMG_07246 [Fusarium oxysporum f. sp. melonis 26406]EXL57728.1 h